MYPGVIRVRSCKPVVVNLFSSRTPKSLLGTFANPRRIKAVRCRVLAVWTKYYRLRSWIVSKIFSPFVKRLWLMRYTCKWDTSNCLWLRHRWICGFKLETPSIKSVSGWRWLPCFPSMEVKTENLLSHNYVVEKGCSFVSAASHNC